MRKRKINGLGMLGAVLLAFALGGLASGSGSEKSVARNTAAESGGSSATSASSVEMRKDPRSEAQDLFGLDPGPRGDKRETYRAGSRGHPLYFLYQLALGSAGKYEVEYFIKKTGLKGRQVEVTMDLANEISGYETLHGHLYSDPETIEENERAIEESRRVIEKKADEFFKVVPRGRRVKIYKLAERMSLASSIVMQASNDRKSGSAAGSIVDATIADGIKRKKGVMYELFGRGSVDDSMAKTNRNELLEAVEIYLAVSPSPGGISELSEEEQNAYRKRVHARMIRLLEEAKEIDSD